MPLYEFNIGSPVHYCPSHGKTENGIIKDIGTVGKVFVVYKCNDDWANYKDYTGQNTDVKDLEPGWVDESGVPAKDPFMTEEDHLEILKTMGQIEASKIGMLQQAVLLLEVPFLKKMLKDMESDHSHKDAIAILNPRPLLARPQQDLYAAKIQQLRLYIQIANNSKEIIKLTKELGLAEQKEDQLNKIFNNGYK